MFPHRAFYRQAFLPAACLQRLRREATKLGQTQVSALPGANPGHPPARILSIKNRDRMTVPSCPWA